jgi:hypothetical protein
MVKKLLIIALFLSFIPISFISGIQTKAAVLDSVNLIKSGWQQNNVSGGGTFSGESFFRSPTISNLGVNRLNNSDIGTGLIPQYVQLFIPYHPNILITNCDPAFAGCAAQYPSFMHFVGSNVTDKVITFRQIYSFTLNVDEEVGPLGWSTIIPVERVYDRFFIHVQTNLLNSTNDNVKKAVILELLQTQAKLQIVIDPDSSSYLFNPFVVSGSFMRSNNNLLPSDTIKEMIVYIDPRFSSRYQSSFLSEIQFKKPNNVVSKTIRFDQATYTRTGNVKGYYTFNLDDKDINEATKFDILIWLVATTNVTTEIPFVNNSFYYNFDNNIYYATFYSGLNVLGRQPFSLLIPTVDFNLPSGHSFWRWNNPLTNEVEIFNENLAPKQDIILFSSSNSVIAPPPIVPDILGGINSSIDTILLNTGFLNPGGLMFLYFILVISISIMVFQFKLSSFIAIILNVLLTTTFLILEYLPLYTTMLLVAFYIIAMISINKGGFLNE